MQQLVLTTHTGVNLNYPLSDLVEFAQQHGANTPASFPSLRQKLELIFSPGQAEGGFVILGLDEGEGHPLVGLLAMESAAASQSGQHRLVTLVVEESHRGQGHGKALLRSGKMLCHEQIWVHLAPDHPMADFFKQAGFEVSQDALVLRR